MKKILLASLLLTGYLKSMESQEPERIYMTESLIPAGLISRKSNVAIKFGGIEIINVDPRALYFSLRTRDFVNCDFIDLNWLQSQLLVHEKLSKDPEIIKKALKSYFTYLNRFVLSSDGLYAEIIFYFMEGPGSENTFISKHHTRNNLFAFIALMEKLQLCDYLKKSALQTAKNFFYSGDVDEYRDALGLN